MAVRKSKPALLRSGTTKSKKRSASKSSSLKRRTVQFNLSKSISKHWHKDGAFKTHFLNSLTLIFPDGEKYFIRSLNPFLKSLTNSKLREEAEIFITQEAQHNIQHRKFFDNLREQGYNIDLFLLLTNFIAYKILEPKLGKKLNLSVTAGLEHYTALLAEIGLESGFLKGAQPDLEALFSWHAAEEIEHKSVAFDMLKHVDDSYALRVAGMFIATSLLVGFSSFCTLGLLAKDGLITNKKVIQDFVELMLVREKLFPKSVMIVLRYLAPNFHPDHIHNKHLASLVFKELKNKGYIQKET